MPGRPGSSSPLSKPISRADLQIRARQRAVRLQQTKAKDEDPETLASGSDAGVDEKPTEGHNALLRSRQAVHEAQHKVLPRSRQAVHEAQLNGVCSDIKNPLNAAREFALRGEEAAPECERKSGVLRSSLFGSQQSAEGDASLKEVSAEQEEVLGGERSILSACGTARSIASTTSVGSEEHTEISADRDLRTDESMQQGASHRLSVDSQGFSGSIGKFMNQISWIGAELQRVTRRASDKLIPDVGEGQDLKHRGAKQLRNTSSVRRPWSSGWWSEPTKPEVVEIWSPPRRNDAANLGTAWTPDTLLGMCAPPRPPLAEGASPPPDAPQSALTAARLGDGHVSKLHKLLPPPVPAVADEEDDEHQDPAQLHEGVSKIHPCTAEAADVQALYSEAPAADQVPRSRPLHTPSFCTPAPAQDLQLLPGLQAAPASPTMEETKQCILKRIDELSKAKASRAIAREETSHISSMLTHPPDGMQLVPPVHVHHQHFGVMANGNAVPGTLRRNHALSNMIMKQYSAVTTTSLEFLSTETCAQDAMHAAPLGARSVPEPLAPTLTSREVQVDAEPSTAPDYVRRHGLDNFLQEALQALLDEQPDRPVEFLVSRLRQQELSRAHQGKVAARRCKKRSSEEYLSKHRVEASLMEAMQQVLVQQPENPLDLFAAVLQSRAGGNGSSSTAADQAEAKETRSLHKERQLSPDREKELRHEQEHGHERDRQHEKKHHSDKEIWHEKERWSENESLRKKEHHHDDQISMLREQQSEHQRLIVDMLKLQQSEQQRIIAEQGRMMREQERKDREYLSQIDALKEKHAEQQRMIAEQEKIILEQAPQLTDGAQQVGRQIMMQKLARSQKERRGSDRKQRQVPDSCPMPLQAQSLGSSTRQRQVGSMNKVKSSGRMQQNLVGSKREKIEMSMPAYECGSDAENQALDFESHEKAPWSPLREVPLSAHDALHRPLEPLLAPSERSSSSTGARAASHRPLEPLLAPSERSSISSETCAQRIPIHEDPPEPPWAPSSETCSSTSASPEIVEPSLEPHLAPAEETPSIPQTQSRNLELHSAQEDDSGSGSEPLLWTAPSETRPSISTCGSVEVEGSTEHPPGALWLRKGEASGTFQGVSRGVGKRFSPPLAPLELGEPLHAKTEAVSSGVRKASCASHESAPEPPWSPSEHSQSSTVSDTFHKNRVSNFAGVSVQKHGYALGSKNRAPVSKQTLDPLWGTPDVLWASAAEKSSCSGAGTAQRRPWDSCNSGRSNDASAIGAPLLASLHDVMNEMLMHTGGISGTSHYETSAADTPHTIKNERSLHVSSRSMAPMLGPEHEEEDTTEHEVIQNLLRNLGLPQSSHISTRAGAPSLQHQRRPSEDCSSLDRESCSSGMCSILSANDMRYRMPLTNADTAGGRGSMLPSDDSIFEIRQDDAAPEPPWATPEWGLQANACSQSEANAECEASQLRSTSGKRQSVKRVSRAGRTLCRRVIKNSLRSNSVKNVDAAHWVSGLYDDAGEVQRKQYAASVGSASSLDEFHGRSAYDVANPWASRRSFLEGHHAQEDSLGLKTAFSPRDSDVSSVASNCPPAALKQQPLWHRAEEIAADTTEAEAAADSMEEGSPLTRTPAAFVGPGQAASWNRAQAPATPDWGYFADIAHSPSSSTEPQAPLTRQAQVSTSKPKAKAKQPVQSGGQTRGNKSGKPKSGMSNHGRRRSSDASAGHGRRRLSDASAGHGRRRSSDASAGRRNPSGKASAPTEPFVIDGIERPSISVHADESFAAKLLSPGGLLLTEQEKLEAHSRSAAAALHEHSIPRSSAAKLSSPAVLPTSEQTSATARCGAVAQAMDEPPGMADTLQAVPRASEAQPAEKSNTGGEAAAGDAASGNASSEDAFFSDAGNSHDKKRRSHPSQKAKSNWRPAERRLSMLRQRCKQVHDKSTDAKAEVPAETPSTECSEEQRRSSEERSHDSLVAAGSSQVVLGDDLQFPAPASREAAPETLQRSARARESQVKIEEACEGLKCEDLKNETGTHQMDLDTALEQTYLQDRRRSSCRPSFSYWSLSAHEEPCEFDPNGSGSLQLTLPTPGASPLDPPAATTGDHAVSTNYGTEGGDTELNRTIDLNAVLQDSPKEDCKEQDKVVTEDKAVMEEEKDKDKTSDNALQRSNSGSEDEEEQSEEEETDSDEEDEKSGEEDKKSDAESGQPEEDSEQSDKNEGKQDDDDDDDDEEEDEESDEDDEYSSEDR